MVSGFAKGGDCIGSRPDHSSSGGTLQTCAFHLPWDKRELEVHIELGLHAGDLWVRDSCLQL